MEEQMEYTVGLQETPVVREIYEIERNTVWQCADRRNIIVLLTKGSCNFCILGKNILLSEGEALLIPAGQEYIRTPVNGQPCTLFYLHFETHSPIAEAESAGENESPLFLHLAQKTVLGEKKSEAVELLQKIHELRHSEMEQAPVFSAGYLFRYLGLLSSAAQTRNRDLPPDARLPVPLQKAITYMRCHYREKINLTDLSFNCGITPQHMIRLFRKHFDTTPVAYLNRYRILQAIDLLRISELTVKEISYSIGFEDQNYFSRVFTQIVGVSPTARRKQIWNYRK